MWTNPKIQKNKREIYLNQEKNSLTLNQELNK